MFIFNVWRKTHTEIGIEIRSKVFLNFKFFPPLFYPFIYLPFIIVIRVRIRYIFLKKRILPSLLKNLPEKSVTTIFIYRWKTEIGRGIRSRQRTNVKRLSRGSSRIDHVGQRVEQGEGEREAKRCHFLSYNKKRKTNLEKKRACFIPQSSWIYATSS